MGDSDRPAGPTRRERLALTVGASALVIALDQITKVWAVAELTGRDIDLVWTLRLHLIRNTGSAFGLGSGFGRWLAVLVVAVVVAVIGYSRRVADRRLLVLLGVVVGGALGNLIDRVVRADDGFLSGGVVDFIDLQWWPVFNVADMAVVGGALGLMLMTARLPLDDAGDTGDADTA